MSRKGPQSCQQRKGAALRGATAVTRTATLGEARETRQEAARIIRHVAAWSAGRAGSVSDVYGMQDATQAYPLRR